MADVDPPGNPPGRGLRREGRCRFQAAWQPSVLDTDAWYGGARHEVAPVARYRSPGGGQPDGHMKLRSITGRSRFSVALSDEPSVGVGTKTGINK